MFSETCGKGRSGLSRRRETLILDQSYMLFPSQDRPLFRVPDPTASALKAHLVTSTRRMPFTQGPSAKSLLEPI